MKSFYHFLMKFRHPKPKDAISVFANEAYLDHSFPKISQEYNEVSSYLEFNGHYLESMTVFDEAWELYIHSETKHHS
ncbi:YozE family protein [Neobacillus niacini]|uniref:YozE family protein n=1 Tax=Neobacillus niacini TaxID=86668 RepID=UPI001A9E247C|nr:YozE family protein [Neobacillus niacini]